MYITKEDYFNHSIICIYYDEHVFIFETNDQNIKGSGLSIGELEIDIASKIDDVISGTTTIEEMNFTLTPLANLILKMREHIF